MLIASGTVVTMITEIRNGIVRPSGFCFRWIYSMTSVTVTIIVDMTISLVVRFILFSFACCERSDYINSISDTLCESK